MNEYWYVAGIGNPNVIWDSNAPKYELDYLIEIPPEETRMMGVAPLFNDIDQGTADPKFREFIKRFKSQLNICAIRNRFQNLITCLFKSEIQMSRDELANLICTFDHETIQRAKIM